MLKAESDDAYLFVV